MIIKLIKLSEFSLQIMQGKCYITASGFFKMNYDALHSMIAAATSYLVIFIQFYHQ